MKRTNDNNGAMIASNDTWKTNQQTRIESINIPLTDDSESAISPTCRPACIPPSLPAKAPAAWA
jgi:hypothetical protein